jgi:hypothetical protein
MDKPRLLVKLAAQGMLPKKRDAYGFMPVDYASDWSLSMVVDWSQSSKDLEKSKSVELSVPQFIQLLLKLAPALQQEQATTQDHFSNVRKSICDVLQMCKSAWEQCNERVSGKDLSRRDPLSRQVKEKQQWEGWICAACDLVASVVETMPASTERTRPWFIPPAQKQPIVSSGSFVSSHPSLEDLPARQGPDTGGQAPGYHIDHSVDSVVHLCACLPWGTQILQKIKGLGDHWPGITAGTKRETPLDVAVQQQQLENVRFLISVHIRSSASSEESEHIAAIAGFLLVKKTCSTLAEARSTAMQMLPS